MRRWDAVSPLEVCFYDISNSFSWFKLKTIAADVSPESWNKFQSEVRQKQRQNVHSNSREPKKISLLPPSALLLPVSCLKISLKNKTETGATLKTRSDYSDSTATSY